MQFQKGNTARYNSNIIIAGDFNSTLSFRYTIKKETSELIDIINQTYFNIHLQNVTPKGHRIYMLLSSPWNFFQNWSYFRIYNKYKKTEITCCIFSYHNRIKVEINNKRNYKNYSNTWRLKNSLLNDQK
jgi:hypothetical protein